MNSRHCNPSRPESAISIALLKTDGLFVVPWSIRTGSKWPLAVENANKPLLCLCTTIYENPESKFKVLKIFTFPIRERLYLIFSSGNQSGTIA